MSYNIFGFGSSASPAEESKGEVVAPPSHMGRMNCMCALAVTHDLKPMKAPLPKDGLNHRDDRCKWDCCGESWGVEYCTSVRSKLNVIDDERSKVDTQDNADRLKEAAMYDRLNPPPIYPSDEGVPEDINEKARRMEQAALDSRSPADEGTTDPIANGEGDEHAADGASFFDTLAATLNPISLMEALGEGAVGALGAIGAVSMDNILMPVITPVFGFDRGELDQNIGALTEAEANEKEYRKRLLRSAELYVDMLSMPPSEVDTIVDWLHQAVQAWLTVFGKNCRLVQVPCSLEDNDQLLRLIGELDESFSSGLAAQSSRMSLAATLSPTRHLSESVFFDWYVMCRFNNVRFAIPEFSGFPVLDSDCTSFVARCLRGQPAIYVLLKDRHTASGFTFDKAIQPAIDAPGSLVGCVAGDAESYTVLRELYVAVALEAGISVPRVDTEGRGIRIDFWAHGDRHDMTSPLKGFAELDPIYVTALQLECSRNLQGFPLAAHVNRAERIAVEKLLKSTFTKLQARKGIFATCGYTQHAVADPPIPTPPELLVPGTGLARDWPYGRGNLAGSSDSKVATGQPKIHVSVNEGDHLEICATLDCLSAAEVGAQRLMDAWRTAVTDIEDQLHATHGFLYMRDPVFGFISTDPTNAGTALHTRAVVRLPFLTQQPDEELVSSLCVRMGLEGFLFGTEASIVEAEGRLGCRPSAKADSWVVRGRYRLGCSEVEQVQALIDGLKVLVGLEKCLSSQPSDMHGFDSLIASLPKVYCMPAVASVDSQFSQFVSRKFTGKVGVDVSDDVPLFTAKHQSATACVLQQNPQLYYSLVPKTSAAGGWSVAQATQSACDCPGCPVGIYLKGEQAYQAADRLLVPILASLHEIKDAATGERRPFNALHDVHRTDLKLYNVHGLSALDPRYLQSFAVEVSRNIRGLPMAPAISRKLRRTVEHLLYTALAGINEMEIAGRYFSLADLERADSEHSALARTLSTKGQLPLLPDPADHRSIGGLTRDWPDARGVFVSSDGIMHMHLNAWDHLKVAYECNGDGDSIGKLVHRLSTNLLALEDALIPAGLTFMHSERLGYLTATPSLIGTAMKVQARLGLPLLTKYKPGEINIVCRQFWLSPESLGGGVWLVESIRCLGQTEVEQTQQVIDACLLLIRAEKDLAETETDAGTEAAPRRTLLQDVEMYIAANPSGCAQDATGVVTGITRTEYPLLAIKYAMLECGMTGDGTSVFVGESACLINDGVGAADKVMWIDPFTRTLHWSNQWQHTKSHRSVSFSNIAHFRPGGYARASTAQGERPMNFTLVLTNGIKLPFEMKAELPDEAQSQWTRAMLYFIDHPKIDLGVYDVDVGL